MYRLGLTKNPFGVGCSNVMGDNPIKFLSRFAPKAGLRYGIMSKVRFSSPANDVGSNYHGKQNLHFLRADGMAWVYIYSICICTTRYMYMYIYI